MNDKTGTGDLLSTIMSGGLILGGLLTVIGLILGIIPATVLGIILLAFGDAALFTKLNRKEFPCTASAPVNPSTTFTPPNRPASGGHRRQPEAYRDETLADRCGRRGMTCGGGLELALAAGGSIEGLGVAHMLTPPNRFADIVRLVEPLMAAEPRPSPAPTASQSAVAHKL